MLGVLSVLASCGAPAPTAIRPRASSAKPETQDVHLGAKAADPNDGEGGATTSQRAAPPNVVQGAAPSSTQPHSPPGGDAPGDARPQDATTGRTDARASRASDELTPLTEVERAIVGAIPSEPIPAPKEFYYRSNEWRHDLLASSLRGLGGAVVGVGADQCYTLAALSKASFVFAMDYDERLPLVHELYAVLVPLSETPAALIERFAPERERETLALLATALAQSPKKVRVLFLYQSLRDDWYPYLQRLAARTIEGQPGTWLATAEHYAHVRRLFQSGRVVARTGDLTGERTLRAIGKAARELGVPVRVLYTSNAEQFFRYTPAFRANIAGLPFDERSLVVRTLRDKRFPNARGDKWHYILEELVDFHERLETGVYTRSWTLLEDLIAAGAPHLDRELSRITRTTPRTLLERRKHMRASRPGP